MWIFFYKNQEPKRLLTKWQERVGRLVEENSQPRQLAKKQQFFCAINSNYKLKKLEREIVKNRLQFLLRFLFFGSFNLCAVLLIITRIRLLDVRGVVRHLRERTR